MARLYDIPITPLHFIQIKLFILNDLQIFGRPCCANYATDFHSAFVLWIEF